MATLPTNRTTSNTRDEHVTDHNELHTGHNLNETHRGRTDNPHGTTAAQVGAQPTDADLTAIAALDSATAGAISSDGAGWIKKTYAQFKTALGLVKADVGLGNVDNTADTAKPVSTAQQAAIDNVASRLGDLLDWQYVRKTADESITSSTTLQDDDHLLLAIGANQTWLFDLYVRYSAATTGDFKLGFTVPTGATVAWSTPGSPGITHPRSRGAAPTDWDELDAVNASTTLGIHILGIVVNGATAGNLTFQWAQAVSDATATSVKTNSFLTARRVA